MTWQPHVTVATIIERDGLFLLVKEWADGKEKYNQPAGHLEPNETLQAAALRETFEETGWHIELTGVNGVCVYKAPSNNVTYVRTTFIGKAIEHDPMQALDDGIIEALWLSRNEIADLADQLRSPMVLQVIDDYLAGNRFPLEVVS